MIKLYDNGKDFINENKTFLETNKYLSVFFFMDAPLLTKLDNKNYAIKFTFLNKTLLAIKVVPFKLMLFGDKMLLLPLIKYLYKNNYEIGDILSSEKIGLPFMRIMKVVYKLNYKEELPMDFMECSTLYNLDLTEQIGIPSDNDAELILENLNEFIKDCGLQDQVVPKERLLKTIKDFRIIKKDDKIVSMAKRIYDLENSNKISDVYTIKEYRGRGYAKLVVGYVMNEIISDGKTATLNVDRNNPISYHLYTSLGFKKVFSQGEFRRIKDIKTK